MLSCSILDGIGAAIVAVRNVSRPRRRALLKSDLNVRQVFSYYCVC